MGHEAAALLPCHCVIGYHCAREWLSPHELGYVSCPFCKHEFVEMFEEPDLDFGAATQPSLINNLFSTRELSTNQEEIQEEEEMARQVAQMTTTTDGFEEHAWHFPSIEEVLIANAMNPLRTSATIETPNIVVTNPENATTSNHEMGMGRPISNRRTTVTSRQEYTNGLNQTESDSIGSGSQFLGVPIPAVKAEDVVGKRSGI